MTDPDKSSNARGGVGEEYTEDAEPFRLRSYQDEMLDESLKRNSIVVLDTGAGKTHISRHDFVLLLQNASNAVFSAIARIRAELDVCDKDKLVWFLAPTVALCLQHNISLQTNLPAYQIRVLSGEDEVERWTEQIIWDAVLKNIRIVISTYAVLLDALTHGFITMPRLALCVFDEAHHCKKSHPANLIMQSFYFPAKRNGSSIPHILGLSASPVMNARTGGLELLETNLDGRVVTPKLRRSELMRYVHVPELLKYEYTSVSSEDQGAQSLLYGAFWRALKGYDLKTDPYVVDLKASSDPAAATQLMQVQLSRRTYCVDQLKALTTRVDVILQDLGPSALDWYLRACFRRMKKGLDQTNSYWMPELSEKEKRRLAQILGDIVNTAEIPAEPTSRLSPKSRLLLETLAFEAARPSFTGIVFAEQRAVVATLAATISSHPLTASLFNIGTFVGGSSSPKRKDNIGDIVELTGQQQNLDDFRVGKKNLIIATSVLEEGIDVSSCQTVICFDPPKNLISFVQRRGRARKKDSKYIVLLGKGDVKGEPAKWQNLEQKMKAAYLEELRNAQLAAELEGRADFDRRQYLVPSTGALLTTENAKAHLYHFCATLLTGGQLDLKPVFSCYEDPLTRLVTAEVTLPAAVHPSIRRAQTSRPFQTERAAMANAAFEAYVMLHKAGLVNDNLLPLRIKVNDLAQDVPSRPSLIQVLPRLNPWSLSLHDPPHWSRSIVELEIGGEKKGSLRMMLPVEIPPISEIDLHWSASVKGTVCIHEEARDATDLDPDMWLPTLAQASHETITLLSAVSLASRLKSDKKDFVAMFQPCGLKANLDVLPAWGVISENRHAVSPLDYGLLRLKGQLGRAFVFQQTVPSSAGAHVRARKFPKKRDFVHRPDKAASLRDTPIVELALDECTMDVLPARYTFTAACIPSILHCIEEAILARELQRTILEPIYISNLDLIIEATTASAANHQTNYERLEYLGDAVLKYFTHVQLMAQHPTWPESFLTTEKGRTNGNASLAKAALRTGIHRFITTRTFTTHHWQLPYLSDAIDSSEKKEQRSTKTLADVVEALIGASFFNKGLEGALTCIRIFLPDELWFDLSHAHDMLRHGAPVAKMQNSELLEDLIGYQFNNQSLLLEATTHASFQSSESTLSYERLEFLGDAILDQIVVPELFRYQPQLKNHEMHRLRQSLANAHFLGFLCMELNIEQGRNDVVKDVDSMLNGFALSPTSHKFQLCDFLRCGQSVIAQRHAALSKHVQLRDRILQALHHSQEYPWAALFELHPPKIFCDMFESLLGAIYIDSHGSLDTCRTFLERFGLLKLMRRFLDERVRVGYPKETLGILADKDRVFYETRKSGLDGEENRMFECTVRVGDRKILTVYDCARSDEAEVKAAAEAARLLLQERANPVSQQERSEDNEGRMDED